MEIWQIVIPILTTILGYLFGKWDTERKRKWELDDRKYKRRSDVYDVRIKEARDVVINFQAVILEVNKYVLDIESKRENYDNDELLIKRLDEFKMLKEELGRLISEAEKNAGSFVILGDDKLALLAIGLFRYVKAILAETEVFLNRAFWYDNSLYEKERVKKFSLATIEASKLITSMQQRLDELYQSME